MSTYVVLNKVPEVVDVHVSDFLGWQDQVYNMMTNNSRLMNGVSNKRTKIQVVYDKKGNSGKFKFVTALNESDSRRYLILFCSQGIIRCSDLSLEVNRARERGWSGDSCIIVAVFERLDSESCSTLEKAVDGLITVSHESNFTEYWEPVNMWVLTRHLPDLISSVASNWKIYKIEESSSHHTPPHMRELSFLDTLDMYYETN